MPEFLQVDAILEQNNKLALKVRLQLVTQHNGLKSRVAGSLCANCSRVDRTVAEITIRFWSRGGEPCIFCSTR